MLRLLPYSLVLLLLVSPVQALEIKPYSSEYTVHYNGFKVGEMTQRLEKREDQTYLLETVVYTTGLMSLFKKDRVTERSLWRYVDGQVQPLSYRYHYSGRNDDVVERIDFDWQKMEAVSLNKGKKTRLPLEPGTYDKQSYQIAMRHNLAQGVKIHDYKVANRDKLRDFHLEVAGREKVMTPFGEVKAIKVKKGTTMLWVAEKYDYLVVKIEQNEDGNLATSYITEKSP